METEIYAERQMYSGQIALYLVQRSGRDSATAMPVVFAPREDFSQVDPFLRIDITTAQSLMDQLWHCGLRPSEGTGSAGALAATEKHLQDMRCIAFKSLGIQ